jgi:D-sedoheptulose 7-phosphate isomerase
MNKLQFKQSTYDYLNEFIIRYPLLNIIESSIIMALQIMLATYYNNGLILVCGNGGSASDSEHIVGELMKSFILNREIRNDLKERLKDMFPEDYEYLEKSLAMSIPSISLVSQTSLITAVSNDIASDISFAQQVLGYGGQNSTLLALSTSGESSSVIYAAKIAKVLKMNVIALTSDSNNTLNKIADVSIKVPAYTTHIIQEFHLPIYHIICICLENEIFGK